MTRNRKKQKKEKNWSSASDPMPTTLISRVTLFFFIFVQIFKFFISSNTQKMHTITQMFGLSTEYDCLNVFGEDVSSAKSHYKLNDERRKKNCECYELF